MFQHLDDPEPLRPATPEHRRATVHRGVSLRRRRFAKVGAAAAAAAVAVTLTVAFALSPALRGNTVAPPPVAASPPPSSVATATVGPGRGAATFGGSEPQLPVTFTMPAGWETDNGWLLKADNYGRSSQGTGMPFGFVFLDVANIYVDGCKWRLLEPPPGPTVDDLVTAFQKMPGSSGTASDTTVDGFRGKLIDYTVPDFKAETCENGRFGLFNEDGYSDDTPNIVAQMPHQQNELRILDVDGTRLVILAGHPPDISSRDRAELDAIINSITIG